jgi:hypothetical protein
MWAELSGGETMATYREQERGNNVRLGEDLTNALEQQRRQVEELARTLSQQATDQWRKAIEGLVALPAAIAVGYAATTLYVVGFVARGFEVFQRTALDARAEVQRIGEQPIGRGREGKGIEGERPTA